jgi:hypothetical protein
MPNARLTQVRACWSDCACRRRDRRACGRGKTRRRPGPPGQPSGLQTSADDGAVRRVSGQQAGYTLTQSAGSVSRTGWHSRDYPALPGSSQTDGKPDVFACGFCHRPTAPGSGECEPHRASEGVTSFRQMADSRAARARAPCRARAVQLRSSLPGGHRCRAEAAATYFSSIKPVDRARWWNPPPRRRLRVTAWYFTTMPGDQEPSDSASSRSRRPRTIRQPRHPARVRRLCARGQHQARSGAWCATGGGSDRSDRNVHGGPGLRASGHRIHGLAALAELSRAPAATTSSRA